MATSISILSGEYKINSGSWTNIDGTVQNGDVVKVRRESASNYTTKKTTVLIVGGYSTNFDVTTKAIEYFLVSDNLVGSVSSDTCYLPIGNYYSIYADHIGDYNIGDKVYVRYNIYDPVVPIKVHVNTNFINQVSYTYGGIRKKIIFDTNSLITSKVDC